MNKLAITTPLRVLKLLIYFWNDACPVERLILGYYESKDLLKVTFNNFSFSMRVE